MNNKIIEYVKELSDTSIIGKINNDLKDESSLLKASIIDNIIKYLSHNLNNYLKDIISEREDELEKLKRLKENYEQRKSF